MDAPLPAEALHPPETASALRQALPRLNTSKAINMWVEIRTFKALYSALRRVAGDIFLKYIDANSGALDLPPDVRLRIREKAVLTADKTLSYDTFDEAREYVILNLERELGGPERTASELPPTIVFPAPRQQGHRKQREMFGFLSDGDETEDQQQLLRSERKKVAEMSEALAAWYGPGWEGELKRRKKELKARARDAEKERERVEDEDRRERERRRKEEAFPGVPLHSEADSLAKLKKRTVTTEVPAFPGIPLYDERLRPRAESLRHRVDPRDRDGFIQSELAAEDAPPPPPPLGKQKERIEKGESREKDFRKNNAPLQREEDPTPNRDGTGASPPSRGFYTPIKSASGSAEAVAANAASAAPSAAEEGSGSLTSPTRTGSGVKLAATPPTPAAFPGIPLHFVEDRPKERSQSRGKSLSPGGSARDAVTQQPRPPEGKK